MQYLQNYFIYNDRVDLLYTDGHMGTIFFNEASGSIYYRFKVNTISNVKHPGIYLGYDSLGNHYYVHNHFENGKPAIVAEANFSLGQPLYAYDEPVINTPGDIINNALDQVLKGKEYNWFNYNCQSFVNTAGQSKSRSQAVENWAGGIGLGLLILFGIKNIKL